MKIGGCQSMEQRAAFDHGQRSRRAGRGLLANPYTGVNAQAWREGWDAATPGDGGDADASLRLRPGFRSKRINRAFNESFERAE